MNNTKIFLRTALLLTLAVTWASLAQAQTCSITWTGAAGDGLWGTADNWKPRAVPGPTDDVCVPSNAVNGGPYSSGFPSISAHSIQVGQSSSVTFGSGTVSVATTVTINNGFLTLLGTTLSATSVDIPSSTLLGQNATIEGSLTNDGFLEPDQGTITVTGDYTQTSSGQLSEQWGSAAILNVNGNATLSGFLEVHYDPKKPPKSGSTYTVMTYGSESGGFTEISPNITVTVKYTQNSAVAKFD